MVKNEREVKRAYKALTKACNSLEFPKLYKAYCKSTSENPEINSDVRYLFTTIRRFHHESTPYRVIDLKLSNDDIKSMLDLQQVRGKKHEIDFDAKIDDPSQRWFKHLYATPETEADVPFPIAPGFTSWKDNNDFSCFPLKVRQLVEAFGLLDGGKLLQEFINKRRKKPVELKSVRGVQICLMGNPGDTRAQDWHNDCPDMGNARNTKIKSSIAAQYTVIIALQHDTYWDHVGIDLQAHRVHIPRGHMLIFKSDELHRGVEYDSVNMRLLIQAFSVIYPISDYLGVIPATPTKKGRGKR